MLNKPTFKGAIVEMFVVVASILIAFGLDAWWQSREDREEEQMVLVALLEEMTAVKDAIEVQRSFHEAVSESIIRLKETTAARSIEIHPDTLDKLLADICWWGGESNYGTGTLTSVITSGKLSLIQNEELRHRIGGWPRVVDDIVENEGFEFDNFKDSWMPYLTKNIYIPQLRRWFTSIPGKEEGPKVLSEVPVRTEPVDHRSILLDPEFVNVLEYRLWAQEDILSDFVEFEAELETIISLIKQELR